MYLPPLATPRLVSLMAFSLRTNTMGFKHQTPSSAAHKLPISTLKARENQDIPGLAAISTWKVANLDQDDRAKWPTTTLRTGSRSAGSCI